VVTLIISDSVGALEMVGMGSRVGPLSWLTGLEKAGMLVGCKTGTSVSNSTGASALGVSVIGYTVDCADIGAIETTPSGVSDGRDVTCMEGVADAAVMIGCVDSTLGATDETDGRSERTLGRRVALGGLELGRLVVRVLLAVGVDDIMSSFEGN
jgi:hypothetical protein